MKGDFKDINVCIAFCRCFDAIVRGKPAECFINVGLGKKGEKLTRAEKSKKILIIGHNGYCST